MKFVGRGELSTNLSKGETAKRNNEHPAQHFTLGHAGTSYKRSPGTDLPQTSSLAQSSGLPAVNGDRLLLASLAGPQETPARSMRRAGAQNVRMRHVLDRLSSLVRLARLVGLAGIVGLVRLVGLVGVRGSGFEIGRGVRRYHRRRVVRIEVVPRLRPATEIVGNCLYSRTLYLLGIERTLEAFLFCVSG